MVPFLVIGMMGFLDLGRAFYFQIALTNAVREAARYGAQSAYYGVAPSCNPAPQPPGPTCSVPPDSAILQRLNQELTGTSITVAAANAVISPAQDQRLSYFNSGTPAQYPIAVTATYNFPFITPLIGSLFGGSITLQSSAQMRTDY